MNFSAKYYEVYQNLPEQLADQYEDLSFDNHCYLRIALDNTFEAKWDTVLKRPAYKNLTEEQKQNVITLLKIYQKDKKRLLEDNRKSLEYRGKL